MILRPLPGAHRHPSVHCTLGCRSEEANTLTWTTCGHLCAAAFSNMQQGAGYKSDRGSIRIRQDKDLGARCRRRDTPAFATHSVCSSRRTTTGKKRKNRHGSTTSSHGTVPAGGPRSPLFAESSARAGLADRKCICVHACPCPVPRPARRLRRARLCACLRARGRSSLCLSLPLPVSLLSSSVSLSHQDPVIHGFSSSPAHRPRGGGSHPDLIQSCSALLCEPRGMPSRAPSWRLPHPAPPITHLAPNAPAALNALLRQPRGMPQGHPRGACPAPPHL